MGREDGTGGNLHPLRLGQAALADLQLLDGADLGGELVLEGLEAAERLVVRAEDVAPLLGHVVHDPLAERALVGGELHLEAAVAGLLQAALEGAVAGVEPFLDGREGVAAAGVTLLRLGDRLGEPVDLLLQRP